MSDEDEWMEWRHPRQRQLEATRGKTGEEGMSTSKPGPLYTFNPSASGEGMSDKRTPTDGKPFYCAYCGAGWNEYGACDDVLCQLESKAAALNRRDDAATATKLRGIPPRQY